MCASLHPAPALVAGLRRLHSGHVGDCVDRLAVGVAGVAALVGPPV
ncbi:hypothetical protein [Streptomyces carpinensis]|nr:hypothetical protein [Streptomyces carpinensis]